MVTIDYEAQKKESFWAGRWPLFILLAAMLLALGFSIVVSSAPRCRHCGSSYERASCASHLKQIGLGILMYSNENQGQYPDRLEDVLLTQDIGPEPFICPSSNDTNAPGATPAEQAANLSAGGHLSYIYLGKGWNDKTVQPTAVVAYEPLSDHGEGGNILFGDGHVSFLSKTSPIWKTLPKQSH